MIVFENNNFIVKQFTFNPFSESTYLAWNKTTSEAMIIDPGCYLQNEKTELKSYILDNEILVKYVVNTHGHIDHIFGNAFCKNEFSAQLAYSALDKPMIDSSKEQAALFRMELQPSPEADILLTEETILQLGTYSASFLFTPGHTPGEYCILFKELDICFTGDVLFKESIGRTDLWGGNLLSLMTSIRTKLFTLDDAVVIFPGHGPSSTIGGEKRNNPFFL